MENLSKRTTAIIAIGFVLFSLGWGYGLQKAQEARNPVVQCEMHSQQMTCASVGKGA